MHSLRLFTLVFATACSQAPASTSPPVRPEEESGPRIVRFDPQALERLGVKSEPAGGDHLEHRLQLPGTIDYNLERYAEISSLVDGRVAQVAVRAGDTVKRNQVLATLVVPQLAEAQAAYLSAQASTSAAAKNAERERALHTKGLTTARELESAEEELKRSDAELAASAARLTALGSELPEGRDAIRASGSLVLRSPIDGVVVRRDAVLGRLLTAGTPAFVVAALSELWVYLDVYEQDVPYVRVGAQVSLVVDALRGRTFQGKVSLVEPQLGRSSRALRARVVVPNPDGALRPGLFARAFVSLDAGEGAEARLFVPTPAVQTLGGRDVLFVERERGQYEIRPVRITHRSPEVAEIVEGLSRGERIVVNGAFVLRGEAGRQ